MGRWDISNLRDESTEAWQELQTDDGIPYWYNTETGENTWDQPEALMSSSDIDASRGEWVWAPHDTEVYVAGKIVTTTGGTCTVQPDNTAKVSCKRSECMPLQKASLKRIVADLTLLDDMSTPLILHNLRSRFEDKKQIYTNVGTESVRQHLAS